MAPSVCHMPNGINLTVTPVFGGVSFKVNELANTRTVFPPGWIIVLNEEDSDEGDDTPADPQAHAAHTGTDSRPASRDTHDVAHEAGHEPPPVKKHAVHRYTRPTLHNDHLFISTVSAPNTAEIRQPVSPTRQIALMLWATLWWYFHQPEPDSKLHTPASAKTPEAGRPRGGWRINIRKEGLFKGKNVMAKLERMGLLACEDSSVGTTFDEKTDPCWQRMFITRRAFWLIDARIFVFSPSPQGGSPFPPSSPFSSRPNSPSRKGTGRDSPIDPFEDPMVRALTPVPAHGGPFHSTSHLPTYYPPHPASYVFTNGILHPLRPKPARQGEVFYVRYVPSVGQYLSFRVASLSKTAPSQQGPWSSPFAPLTLRERERERDREPARQSVSDSVLPTVSSSPNDVELLHRWMNDPRVAHSWGEDGPIEHQEEFLRAGLASRHSFPVIGCFNGRPFAYFELYWVKEDSLGKYIGGDVGDYDRGVHCLVGEQEFRGPHRVKVWLSALVHYCLLADMRTDTVMLEPRVDNEKWVKKQHY